MTNVVINGLSLRPGGGLQVLTAMLAGMIEKDRGHKYIVLVSDANSENFLKTRFEGSLKIRLQKPVGSSNNLIAFLWQLLFLKGYLHKLNAGVVIGLNHHFPAGRTPQIIYHVNVLRFERPHKSIFSKGEMADRLRDWRAVSALKKAQANVFESSYLEKLATTRISKINNPNLIYIGLESPDFSLPSDYKKTSDPAILSLTSIQPHKDNPTLIRTLAVLKNLRPDVNWRLKIAGGMNPRAFSELNKLAETLLVSNQIDWLGFQKHDKLATQATQSLCLISTSLVESFSMVALEAMSWSCPAIVCRTTSMPESVGEAGLLAAPGNAGDFASKIISLYENCEMREALINKGHVHIKSMSWRKAADSFEEIITTLIGSKAKA